LDQQGYTRIHHEETITRDVPAIGKKAKKPTRTETRRVLHVIQDRFRFHNTESGRIMEALDAALKQGDGHIAIHVLNETTGETEPWRFSNRLHCAHCDIDYASPLPSTFSF